MGLRPAVSAEAQHGAAQHRTCWLTPAVGYPPLPSIPPLPPLQVGTLQYLSPEVLLGRPHSLASDVFALAVTVNELAVGAVPYSDCTRDNPLAHTVLEMGYGRQELAVAVAAEGLRPTMHEGTPPPLQSLLEACWAREPAQRPTAADVASQLAAMAAAAAAAASPPAVPSTPQPAVLPAVLPVPPSEHARRLFASGSDDDGGCVDASGSDKPAALWRVHVHTDGDAEMAKADAADSSSPCSSGSPSSKSAPGGLPAWLAPLQQQQQQVEGALGAQGLQAGTFLTAGRRDAQEDTLAVLHAPFGTAAPGCTALGVFDGHRGGSASDYLAAHLQQHLAARLAVATSGADLLGGALLDADGAFRAADDAAWQARLARMGQAAAGRRPSPGSTATLLLVYPGQPQQGQPQPQQQMLAVAHLGDSRVVLCRDGQVRRCCTVAAACASLLQPACINCRRLACPFSHCWTCPPTLPLLSCLPALPTRSITRCRRLS